MPSLVKFQNKLSLRNFTCNTLIYPGLCDVERCIPIVVKHGSEPGRKVKNLRQVLKRLLSEWYFCRRMDIAARWPFLIPELYEPSSAIKKR